MRFAAVGSGSRGNATLIEAGGTRLLIDCGFSRREIEARLAALDVEPGSLDAILVTHEHGDHIAGVGPFAAHHRLPVWATPGTWRAAGCRPDTDVRLFVPHGHGGVRIGDLRVRPFPVPHDAREPCQLVVEGNGRKLGVLTDTGTITTRIRERLGDCDALMLEANHDPALLRCGPYPPSLQARVGGAFGHLSNRQAAELLDGIGHERLTHLVLAHVSAHNNRPDLARSAVGEVSADLAARSSVASQDGCTGWYRV